SFRKRSALGKPGAPGLFQRLLQADPLVNRRSTRMSRAPARTPSPTLTPNRIAAPDPTRGRNQVAGVAIAQATRAAMMGAFRVCAPSTNFKRSRTKRRALTYPKADAAIVAANASRSSTVSPVEAF